MSIWSNSKTGGVTVTVSNQAALLTDLQTRLEAGQGFSVATLNLDHVVKLNRNAAFRAAYEQHSHVTADGNPIVWLSRLARRPVALVPGSELIDPLCAVAARLDVPVGFYGASEETLSAATEHLQARYPGLHVVFRKAPDMEFDPASQSAQEDMAALEMSGARLCFLALGAPKQEMLAAQTRKMMPDLGFISIGAGLDFIAGSQQRAPAWVRKLAAEWIWRLVHDPKRLAVRYGLCVLMMPKLVFRACAVRWRSAERSC